MLSALIVDDEILSVKMLEHILDWESLGIRIIGTAHNGLEALNQCYKQTPNIIITDIKMPQLNGLDFIRKIREVNPETEFILISAYADFDYVKKAIELGCSNYILKPVDEFELERTLQKIATKISDKKAAEKNAAKNRIQHEKQVLYRYMSTGTNPLAAAKSAVNLDIDLNSYALFSFVLSDHSINDYIENSVQLDAQMGFIMERMAAVMNRFGISTLFDYEEYVWTAILSGCDSSRLPLCAEQMVSFFAEEIRMEVYVCFSQLGSGINELPRLFDRLRHLSRYSFYIGEERILGYGYNCEETRFEQMELLPFTQNMMAALQRNDIRQAAQIVDEVLLMSCKADPASLHLFFEFCYNAVSAVRDKLIAENKLTPDTRYILNISYKDISQITKAEEMSGFMKRLLFAISENPNADRPKYSALVEAGIQYLHDHYDRNLSLEEICNRLAVSKNYFSYLFKRETGQNLWAYLTDVRLNKSKELLSATDLKSYEIAYMVGYDNPSYFSKLFKKSTGLTPNEFRAAEAQRNNMQEIRKQS
ncbi:MULTISPECIES: response regulator [unclassified Paenibacillus]|uniref:response regulator transcription factor n=1 Tax=unclassified Paenibacillus TaxID=185978 RepID=UPI001C0F8789|nr:MULTISPECIES: response regulator [unclassified Paenibacillus]MBU5444432.1 response regulator [Paenibacillus sp. MSJ-34]CAH0120140.1 Protein-glutamate methylesterase/protein-glutamine glutaminase [Paenibacillus sp. CECT 9249]